jgi:adenylosuccinate synthase
VEQLVNAYIDQGKRILIEGTQGFDLSLHHGTYPYVTSRDTTAGTFLGEVGVSPKVVKDIILVIRTFPIRASNGPIFNEINWAEVTKHAQSDTDIIEYTSVTKKVRRVGTFDYELVKKAVRINRPTQLAINFIDYINAKDSGIRDYALLSDRSKEFVKTLEERYGVPVTLIGTGPNILDIVDVRAQKGFA